MVLPVPWLDKQPGIWCHHCNIGVGCKIWGDGLPDHCRDFECSYRQVQCSTDLRPDKIKVIFEKLENDIFLCTMHPKYNDAFKKRIVTAQINDFLRQGYSVVINSFTLKKPIIAPTQGKKAHDIWIETNRQAHDRTIIHN